MKLYKLTDEKGYTLNNTYWKIGITVVPKNPKGSPKLCTNTVLHAYTSPLLAVLMNPAHAGYQNPQCFIVEGDIAVTDGTKVGCVSLTPIETIKLPLVSTTQSIAFGILCALEVNKSEPFATWALHWLDGSDTSAYSAYDAAYACAASNAAYACAASNAAYASAYAAVYASAYASAVNKAINFQDLAEQAMTY